MIDSLEIQAAARVLALHLETPPDVAVIVARICLEAARNASPIKLSVTGKQAHMLAYIRSFSEANDGRSPSYDEMAYALSMRSKSGVHRMVTALVERGHIHRIPGRARTIVLV